MSQSQLIIVGGPNGSGKTTVAEQYALQTGYEYISADQIALEINLDSPASVRIEAGKRFKSELNLKLSQSESCVVESTLSGKTFSNSMKMATQIGFEIIIVFVFVDSADFCIQRVAERVRKGGHSVPEADIRRRFPRSINNFWNLYRHLANHWVVVYNGSIRLQDVSVGSFENFSVRDEALHYLFMKSVDDA